MSSPSSTTSFRASGASRVRRSTAMATSWPAAPPFTCTSSSSTWASAFLRNWRPVVDALNIVPSIQQRHAWFAYQPGICDREELEGLLLRACDVAAMSQARQTLPRGLADRRAGVASVGSDDQADLALILKVVRAYAEPRPGRPPTAVGVASVVSVTLQPPRTLRSFADVRICRRASVAARPCTAGERRRRDLDQRATDCRVQS